MPSAGQEVPEVSNDCVYWSTSSLCLFCLAEALRRLHARESHHAVKVCWRPLAVTKCGYLKEVEFTVSTWTVSQPARVQSTLPSHEGVHSGSEGAH